MAKNTAKRKFEMPHIYVILFILITLAAIASYIVPAGEFAREDVNGTSVIIPGTFEFVAQSPVGILEFMTAIPRGVEGTIIIIFGIMAIGAMFRVIEKAGVIDVIINFLIKQFGNKGLLIIPAIVIPLAIFVSLTGNIESSLIFLPALLPLFLRLGFDRMAATGTVLIATVVGFSLALTAPANLGTAHTIAELPLFSGMGYRGIMLAVMTVIGILFVMRYIKKVEKDPEKTLITDNVDDSQFIKDDDDTKEVTTRTIVATWVFIVALGFMLFGIFQYQWYFIELAGFYIMAGLITGLIGGLKPSQIATAMNEGIQNIILGALIVGVARAIAVMLEDGVIMDTIVHYLSQIVTLLPEWLVPVAMMIVQGLLNFLIPSGSGQAAATMPIMVGIVDLTEMTRQTAVLAFLMGDGFSNIFYPTSGYFMAALAIAKIKYTDWIKFIWPLLLLWYGAGAIFLVIAFFIEYGPM
ncbi:MAG TPA: AbgT family transporter [Candidatus Salinicoccus merdavium]|nr:AbgT family transporter [Candidatus Salinicoccus merdavium]